LTQAQLQRVAILRDQVYNNGSEMNQAQAAIKSAVNFIGPDSTTTMVTYPFGVNATGYLTLSPIVGYFIPNTSDISSAAPAPNPSSLLNRILRNLIRRPPIKLGSKEWLVPGNYTFAIPPNNTVTIEAWGAGGGGGGWDTGTGHRGIDTFITGNGISIIAGGGGGGDVGRYRRIFGAGGIGGAANGGTINLNGGSGGSGDGGARGGNAPNGGTGAPAPPRAVGTYPGTDGNAPGGGGSGGYSRDGSKDPSYQGGGGGGAGGYVLAEYKAIPDYTEIRITVGAGGAGTAQSGSGARGQVIITWA